MSFQDLGVALQILGDGDVDPVAGILGPGHERSLPRPPPGPAAPRRHAVLLGPVEVGERLAIRQRLGLPFGGGRACGGTRGPGVDRTTRGSPRVERRPAPVVVGGVGRRRQDEEDRRRARGPDDEERVGVAFSRRAGGRSRRPTASRLRRGSRRRQAIRSRRTTRSSGSDAPIRRPRRPTTRPRAGPPRAPRRPRTVPPRRRAGRRRRRGGRSAASSSPRATGPYRARIRMPAITITTPATRGATTHASPRRPR